MDNIDNKINDVGEVIEGAKKMLYGKALNLETYNKMTDVEKFESVTKNAIWPVPDYKKLIEDGKLPVLMALTSIIRNRLGAKPRGFKNVDFNMSAIGYIESVSFIRDIFMNAESLEETKGLFKKLSEKIGYNKGMSYDTPEAQFVFSSFSKRTCPYDVDLYDIRKAIKMVEDGFPEKEPVWKKNASIREYNNEFFIIQKGRRVVSGAKTEEEAWSLLKTNYEEKKAKKKEIKKLSPVIHSRPHLERIERKGIDYRNGVDIGADDFMNTFGFRGVQFGEWLPNDERQTVLNMAYDSLMDLANAIDFLPEQISLNGTLAISFGARGSGKASAHYEPGQQVLNMTRLRGAGSVAHEWMHALDHYIASIGNENIMENNEIRFLSGNSNNTNHHYSRSSMFPLLSIEAKQALDALNTSIFYKNVPIEESLENRQVRLKKINSIMEECKKNINEIQEKLNESNVGVRIRNQYKKTLMMENEKIVTLSLRKDVINEEIEYLKNGKILDHKDSDFYKNARIGSEYWYRPTELYARAFENIIEKKIKDNNNSSDYLVHSTDDALYKHNEIFGIRPYPYDEEQKNISDNMLNFIKNIQYLLKNENQSVLKM